MDELKPIASGLQSRIEKLKTDQNIIFDGADVFTDTGYIQYPKFVFFDRRLSDTQRSCYGVILHYAFNHSRTLPGQTEIARFWGVHRNTVSNSMRALEALGYIDTIKRHGRAKDIISISHTVSEMLASNDYAPTPIKFSSGKLGVSLSKPENPDFKSTHGWIEIPAFIYTMRNINDSDRSVYGTLLSYAYGKETCFPKQATIGARLGKNQRTIEDNIAKLRKAKLLESEQRGSQLNNIYTLKLRVNKSAGK